MNWIKLEFTDYETYNKKATELGMSGKYRVKTECNHNSKKYVIEYQPICLNK